MKLLKYLTLITLPAISFAGTPQPRTPNEPTKVPPAMCLCKLSYSAENPPFPGNPTGYNFNISPAPNNSTLESSISFGAQVISIEQNNDQLLTQCTADGTIYTGNKSTREATSSFPPSSEVSLFGISSAICQISHLNNLEDDINLTFFSQAKFPKPTNSDCSSFTTIFSDEEEGTLATATCVEIE